MLIPLTCYLNMNFAWLAKEKELKLCTFSSYLKEEILLKNSFMDRSTRKDIDP